MDREFFVSVSMMVPGNSGLEWAGFIVEAHSAQGAIEAVIDMGVPFNSFTVTLVSERQRVLDRVNWWKHVMAKAAALVEAEKVAAE
jgi:hypothetical protein